MKLDPAAALLRRCARLASCHRSTILFAMAVGFGALAVFGARGYIAEQLRIEKARLLPNQPMVEVVVARRDLESGAAVGPESMALREVPADLVPGSAVRPDRFEHHVGAVLAQPMRSGEPLLASAIVGSDTGAFSTRIRQGIRAMSVLVDEVNSVSGMLQPGDRIDVMFTVRPPVAPGQPPAQEVTTTLMQDLAVLATGRQVRADGEDDAGLARHFTAITVEVTPQQAQELIVAQRTGKLTAMLRNPEDRRPLRTRALDLNTLLGVAPPEPSRTVLQDAGPQIIVGGRGTLVAMPSLARVPIEPDAVGDARLALAAATTQAADGQPAGAPIHGASAVGREEPWSLRWPGAVLPRSGATGEHPEAEATQ